MIYRVKGNVRPSRAPGWLIALLTPVFRRLPVLQRLAQALRPTRLRDQLFLAFALMALLPLLVLGFGYGQVFREQEELSAESELTRAAHAAREVVNNHLEMHQRAIQVLADTIGQLDPVSDTQATSLLAGVARNHPGFLTLLAADGNGRLVAAYPSSRGATVPGPPPVMDISDREYFQQPRKTGQPFVSGVFRGRGFGSDPIVAVSAPVQTTNPQAIALVEGSLDLGYLQRIALGIGKLDGSFAVVVDARGHVVYSSSDDYPRLGLFRTMPAGRAVQSANNPELFTFQQTHRQGSRRSAFLAASLPIPVPGATRNWRVFICRDIAQIHAATQIYQSIIMIILILSLGGALLLGRRLARQITRPVEHLAEVARRLALQEDPQPLSGSIQAKSSEVARLVEDFDAMVKRLNEAYQTTQRMVQDKETLNLDLRRVLDGLDQAVHERTAELAEARDRALAANRAKSEFLALMSHEVRTPLNAILGYAQLLRREPGTSPTVQRNVEVILRSGEHLLALLSDILEMARIEAGRVTLQNRPFRLRTLLADLESLFRLRIVGKGLALHHHVDDSVPIRLRADEGKVRQILVHLLSNATKFTEQGSISIQATAEPTEQGQIRVTLEVADTGCGIRPEEMAVIFEAFEQTQTARHKGKGTGLGLAISRRLAQAMGGGISVQSQPGSGSVFRLEFQAEPVPEQSTEVRSSPADPAQLPEGTRVLVVDDNPDNRDVLAQFLAQAGCVTSTAADGLEALAMCASWNPDLMVADFRMPGLDGCQLVTRVRGLPEGGALPVIMLSADQLDDRRRAALEAGADAFLGKPVDTGHLLTEVRRLLQPPERRSDAQSHASQLPSQPGIPAVDPPPPLPEGDRQRLRSAAAAGDSDRLVQLLTDLDPHHAPLAERLRHMAQGYRYDEILALVDEPSADKSS